jgi:hypothetical protein
VCGGTAENCPDWEDDPGAYVFTATIAGVIVLLDGVLLAEEGDVLAAFDEFGNVRGVAVQLIPPFGPYEGQIVYELQIRSNAQGDLISFQYYDISEDIVLNIVDTYHFGINDVIGGVVDPVFYCIGQYDECGECGGDGSSCSDSLISLEIQNVNWEEGTLDIYMINEVSVSSFQFELHGINVVSVSHNLQDFNVVFNQEEGWPGSVLGFTSGTPLQPGSGVLVTVEFNEFEGEDICFGLVTTETSCDYDAWSINDSNGYCLLVDWGNCYSCENGIDECGECGGDGSTCSEIVDGCDLPDSGTTGYLHLTDDGEVLYKSPWNLGGWQFTVDGALVIDAFGGITEEYGFIISAAGSNALAFSLSGSVIPAGCGILVELELDGDATGLSGLVVSDPNAQSLYFEYFEGGLSEIEGCMDESACNFDSDATVDDGSCLDNDCAGECGGNAVEDCVGECGGSSENCPDWEDDPGAYVFTATIAGVIVLLDGVLLAEEGDVLAAFDEFGNVRGHHLLQQAKLHPIKQ